jgi:hypothetical protein
MTNNKLCDLIGGAGCLITSWHAGLMFFGKTGALWGVIVGIALILFGLFEYE